MFESLACCMRDRVEAVINAKGGVYAVLRWGVISFIGYNCIGAAWMRPTTAGTTVQYYMQVRY